MPVVTSFPLAGGASWNVKFGPSWLKARRRIGAAIKIPPRQMETVQLQVNNAGFKFSGLGQTREEGEG
jgi:hypothetical protein